MVDRAIRRVVDFCAAVVGLVLLSPVMAVIAVLIKRDSAGPVLFRQERVGRFGKPFTLFKFRTMTTDAAPGPSVTAAGDARVTPVGRTLRSTKLDELPQLVNVAKGDMSLVGPRPEVPKYVALWPPQARTEILSIRPGITDPMTVQLRREESLLAASDDPERFYIEELLPQKAQAYVEYVRGRSLGSDARLLINTLVEIIRK